MADLSSQSSYTGGYWCACGTFVQYGAVHACSLTFSNWWPAPQPQRFVRFCGHTRSAADLPSDAHTGDAYYIKEEDTLAVRHTDGWLHYDRANPGA